MAIRKWDDVEPSERKAFSDGRDTGMEHVRQEVRRMVEAIIEKTWYDYDVAPAQMDEVRMELLNLGRYVGGTVYFTSPEDKQRALEAVKHELAAFEKEAV